VVAQATLLPPSFFGDVLLDSDFLVELEEESPLELDPDESLLDALLLDESLLDESLLDELPPDSLADSFAGAELDEDFEPERLSVL
jgi:hypothetical protein